MRKTPRGRLEILTRKLESKRPPKFWFDQFSPIDRILGWARYYAGVVTGRGDPLVPPHHLYFVGIGDFKRMGDNFFRHFVELGGLKPSSKVLDIGCGIGRMTRPLVSYLVAQQGGAYYGIDTAQAGIHWCQSKISKYHKHFSFQLADIYNKMYNPQGTVSAAEYRFPYGDQFFDFIFLTSVFTHMLPKDMDNYLAEIFRMLKIGRKCLLTFFILNQESRSLLDSPSNTIPFRFSRGDYMIVSEETPEGAVAYDETYLRERIEVTGLRIVEPIHYGSWCGRQKFLSLQDLVIVQKC